MAPGLKRILIGVAIGSGVLVSGIWILIHTLGEHETMYQGKALDDWIAQLSSRQPGASNEAVVVLSQGAIPYLTQAMFTDTNDSSLRLMLIDQLNGLPGVTIHYTPADGRRAEAADYLGHIGPGAKSAIPSLIKALKSNDAAIRGPAARALGRIQSQPDTIIPLLMAYLDDPQDGVPEAAVEALGDFGPLSKAAVPKIVPFLKTQDKDLRVAATAAIRKIDPQAVNQH
jgi:HEAT repeat protein